MRVLIVDGFTAGKEEVSVVVLRYNIQKMAKRKVAVTKEKIVGFYTEYLLEHGAHPKTVFAFAKENGFAEQEFYKFFGSFSAIDHQVFPMLFDSTIATLEKSADYADFDAREKLLSYYYTFFENLTANRSLTSFLLKREHFSPKNLLVLKELRPKFMEFVDGIGIETMDLKEEKLQKAQKMGLQESAWVQLMLTLKFWLDDTSAGFEKTDIFIEKAVNTSFELMNVKPLKSLLDFGKFVLQERTGMFNKTSAE